jgi:hypothetical protein
MRTERSCVDTHGKRRTHRKTTQQEGISQEHERKHGDLLTTCKEKGLSCELW